MLSKFKRNKHQQHLAQLPKISQSVDDVDFFYTPATFRETLLEKIASATQRICIVALYLEQDDGGKGILDALYAAKRQRPELDVRVLVDWHRAQRGRIGAAASNTNADWYCRLAQENPGIDVPVYGVPINTREALGVLHFKGFIIDDSVLYSGASLNDVYLHQHDKYRYDRYQLIRNRQMADIMFDWVTQNLMNGRGVNRLDNTQRPKSPEIKKRYPLIPSGAA
ncbi:phosphatidylserine synthase [Salmonella enterica subsp. enterica]|nr:phosphatidylserine synthase [Salmonella enterica subsp. enterica]